MPLEAPVAQPPPVPPTPAAPVAPASPSNEGQHPLVPELMRMLMQDVAADEGATNSAEKKPEEKPDAKPASVAPVEPEKPIQVRKKKVERPTLPIEEPRAVVTVPAPSQTAPPPDNKKFEEGLEENEREMLADAKYLADKFPDQYKDFDKKTEKFLKDHIAWTERSDFDDQDPDYLKFIETNQPRLSRAEIRKVEESRITENVRKEYDTRFNDLNHELFVRETEPKIAQIGQQVYTELATNSLPGDLKKELVEQINKLGPARGYEEAKKAYKMEIETSEEILRSATEDIKELRRLNTPNPKTGKNLAEFALDPNNPKYSQHQRIGALIAQVNEQFKANAGDNAIRNGKWFVTREEWYKIRPDQRHRFWTLSNLEIENIAKGNIKHVIASTIAQKQKYLEERGFSRVRPTAQGPQPALTRTAQLPPRPSVQPGSLDPSSANMSEGAKLAAALNRD